ncbi:MAG: threonylcarbamoyl-AMP synthase [Legionella sp.]|nr:MAG: threonylcarbamoyl-AMP synthase [Legionella sp.]
MIRRLDDVCQAVTELPLGHVFAYPTEAVYGLGCDMFHQPAVERILALKDRPMHKGLIVLIAEWSQLFPLIGDVPLSKLDAIKETWPGPTTWVFPKSSLVPVWVSGEHPTIAIRMTAHPIARQLCERGPIVSTSANPQGQEPARSLASLDHMFPVGLDGVVMGALGVELQPSSIFDALTHQQFR